MKKFMIATAAFGALALPAMAADIAPAPVYTKAPVAVPVCVWCGFYVGVNAGGTFGGDNSVNSVGVPIGAPGAPVGVPGLISATNAATANIPVGGRNGFIGGGQIGYNWQFGAALVGVETDFQGLSSRGSGALFQAAPTPGFPGDFRNTTLTATNSVDYLGTLRGRLGYLWTPSFLIYGTGGLAYGDAKSSTTIFQQPVGPGVVGVNVPYGSAGSFSQTRAGWTAGAGVEWMFMPHWTAKVEYLHYDLGSVSYSPGTLTSLTTAGAVFYSLTSQSSTKFDGDIVRAGLNYKF
jgi:outer membrane immunogenic protein